jgi:hypothetical protein
MKAMSESIPLNTMERRVAERRMIYEMIEASMALSLKKGAHPLTRGCNCIACANKRKLRLSGPIREWQYRL